MKHRAASRYLVLSIAVTLASVVATAQTRGTPAGKPPASTPDGHPDLQGIWLSNAATPLERPKQLEGRAFLTDEEVAVLKQRYDKLFADGSSDFAGGDSAFLAALGNLDRYKNPGTTENSIGMKERVFDNRTSLVVDPPDGRIPAPTPEGRERQTATGRIRGGANAAGPDNLTSDVRCITFGTPRVGGNYGSGHFGYYQIVQTPSYLVLVTEAIHEARVVPLDGGAHLPSNIKLWNGDSRGRWEGNSLVVDTTNFSSKSFFMGATENLHLVERFTRVAPDRIDYQVTFDDPTTWSKPWTVVIRLRHTDEQMYEFACHEGNHDIMRGILVGARTQEK